LECGAGFALDLGLLVRGPRIFLPPFIQPRLLSDTEPGEGVEQSKCVEQPHHYANDDHCIQDRLDGTRHGDELINQPKDDPDDDQGEQYFD
jgi:hypothetical protein